MKHQNEDEDDVVPVPEHIRSRVQNAYLTLGLDEDQPVKKVPLHVDRVDELLMIDELPTNAQGVAGAGTTNAGIAASQERDQAMVIRIERCERAITQSTQANQSAIGELRNYVGENFRVLNNNVRAFGGRIEGSLVRQRRSNQQYRLLNRNEADQAGPMREVSRATLSKLPRHLLTLWREYMFGLHGRKPARLFTTEERNRKEIKQLYYRRNVIWQLMEKQVRFGLTPEQACAELRVVYGNKTSITRMSELIVKDKKRYGSYHPSLSV